MHSSKSSYPLAVTMGVGNRVDWSLLPQAPEWNGSILRSCCKKILIEWSDAINRVIMARKDELRPVFCFPDDGLTIVSAWQERILTRSIHVNYIIPMSIARYISFDSLQCIDESTLSCIPKFHCSVTWDTAKIIRVQSKANRIHWGSMSCQGGDQSIRNCIPELHCRIRTTRSQHSSVVIEGWA